MSAASLNFKPVTLINVFLHHTSQPELVGRLALANRRLFFEYAPEFIARGVSISPLKLPCQTGVREMTEAVFDGLWGVFNDSLPDGWGRMLFDRQLRRDGIDPVTLSPLDRLALIGDRAMGGLSYQPSYAVLDPIDRIRLDELAQRAEVTLAGEADALFPELLLLGGSPAGARPKVLLGVDTTGKKLVYGAGTLPADYVHYLVKFCALSDPKDIGAIELAYTLMAKAAGIEVAPARLFVTRRNRYGYFGAQRFDRVGPVRVHTHTFSGLVHADHRLPTSDYVDLLKLTQHLTRDQRQTTQMYRRMVFNVLAHNRDDHSKNFAFQMDEHGQWTLAPAYDLTFSSGPGGEHSMLVAGEGKAPTMAHLLKVGEMIGLQKGVPQQALEEVAEAIHRWKSFAQKTGVSKKSADEIARAVKLPSAR